jgi:hypothetical protein
VCKGRKIMETIIISKIKKIEGECTKHFEENTQVRTETIEDLEMNYVESKIREVQYQKQ